MDKKLCEGCPVYGLYEPLEPRGPKNARYLIVTDVPSTACADRNELITKKQSSMLLNKLGEQRFPKEDFRFTSACLCAFDPNAHINKEKTATIKHCRQHLIAEVAEQDYEAIIPLGAAAATQAFGRPTKITRVRGLATHSEEFNLPIFPLMSPSQVVAYPQNEPVFDADIVSFARAVDADYDSAKAATSHPGKFEIVEDLQFLIDQNHEVIAFDTENTGLRWYETGCDVRTYDKEVHKGNPEFHPRAQILTMQFSVESGMSYVLFWDHPEKPIANNKKPKLRNQLRKLLCAKDRIVVGQGVKYDCVYLWMTEGIHFKIGGDTLMLATLLDENMLERNLDILTKIHVPAYGGYADSFNATYDKSRMWEVPLKELIPYAATDADVTFQIYQILEQKVMDDEKLWKHYCYVSIPGLNAFAGLETRGMYIDEEKALPEFKIAMIESVRQQKEALLAAIPKRCKQEIVNEYLSREKVPKKNRTAENALSFSRKELLIQILFEHPRGFRLKPKVFTKTTAKLTDKTLQEPSTSSKDHLPYFFEECPFTEQLANYIKDESLLTKSILSFEKKYVRGGMVRPTYNLHTAVTGRSASKDPNGQNGVKRGPQAKAYQSMFVTPPGYYVISCDLSQAELRIAACMANDKTLINIYKKGGDVHRVTGAIVAKLSQTHFDALPKNKQKEYRQKAKACVAEGQLVLTEQRGLIPIEKVLLTDRVWDGVEWVTHEGVVYKGYKEVITYEGLTATPDHKVYTQKWADPVPIGRIASSLGERRLVVSGDGKLPIKVIDYDREDSQAGRAEAKIRGVFLPSLPKDIPSSPIEHTEKENHRVPLPTKCEVWRRQKSEYPRGKVRRLFAEMQCIGKFTYKKLRRSWDRITFYFQRKLCSLVLGAPTPHELQRRRDRQNRQQRSLRAGEFALGVCASQPIQQKNQYKGAVSRAGGVCTSFMASIEIGFPEVQLLTGVHSKTGEATGQRRRSAKLYEEDHGKTSYSEYKYGDSPSLPKSTYKLNKTYAHVYDIVNAGPRHRFTVSNKLVANCNFGLLFGMWWKKLIAYAKTNYGVEFNQKEAEAIYTSFFNKYSGLKTWHAKQKALAHEHGYVRSYSGRIRHLPMINSSEEYIQKEAERQAINSNVQGFASDLGVMALGRMNEEIDPSYLRPVGFIHDALVCYVKKEYLEWGMRTVKRYMESNPIQEWFGIKLQVPIVADAGFGENLGEIHECEGFSLKKRYDFDSVLRDKDGKMLLQIPKQYSPPNGGRILRSPYTDPEMDLEIETVLNIVKRKKPTGGTVHVAAA